MVKDYRVRPELPDGRRVMLIDTVGLLRRLPHHLVEAFRSTLEEAVQADPQPLAALGQLFQLAGKGGDAPLDVPAVHLLFALPGSPSANVPVELIHLVKEYIIG